MSIGKRKELHLTLPLPMSVNHCYFTARNGQRILKKEAKEWITRVQQITAEEVSRQQWTPASSQKVVVEIMTYWKDNRRHDVHNGCKITMDAIEKLVYDDDKWVLPRYIDFTVDKGNPRIELSIYLKEDE